MSDKMDLFREDRALGGPFDDERDERCSLSYCAAPGYQNGVNCRAEQGFRWTSDDWCGCKCHLTNGGGPAPKGTTATPETPPAMKPEHHGTMVMFGPNTGCCSACLHPMKSPPDYPPCESSLHPAESETKR